MAFATRFGRKLKVPSTAQIKHQLLVMWLKDQKEKERAETKRPAAAAVATPVQ